MNEGLKDYPGDLIHKGEIWELVIMGGANL